MRRQTDHINKVQIQYGTEDYEKRTINCHKLTYQQQTDSPELESGTMQATLMPEYQFLAANSLLFPKAWWGDPYTQSWI